MLPQHSPFLLLLFLPTCLLHYKTYVVPRENSKSFSWLSQPVKSLVRSVWPGTELAPGVDVQGAAYTKTLKGSKEVKVTTMKDTSCKVH